MKLVLWRILAIVLVAMAGAGCARRAVRAPNLPAAAPSTTVGAGDIFSVLVVGEKDLPQEFRVQPDGTIDFPYLDRLTVAGLEPQAIEELIKKGLVDKKILIAPQVTLVVRQYNSKKISIIGAVARPGTLQWSEGMKLIDAISQSGGLTPAADGDHVRITRSVSGNRTVTATVSVDDIADGKLSDIPLQAGDTIKIDQRLF
ncbi:MAG TPA: polysaccharide biosynthesis/export family protein [Polyangiaceae bacterium]|nr:polysaccharide biosynthesis/export family protein [Polyangiaceae bacterium]